LTNQSFNYPGVAALRDGTIAKPLDRSVWALFSYFLGLRSDAVYRCHVTLRAETFSRFRGTI
jgi:hypothetical protein